MHNGHRTFPKATVDTTVVRLVKVQGRKEQLDITQEEELNIYENCEAEIMLVRGNIQMDEIENINGLNSVELIHSTELKEGNLLSGRFVTNKGVRLVSGPVVLIPRVGRPLKEKVVCYTGEGTFALSDCVLALICPSNHVAQRIRESLIQNWSLLEKVYSGSGAKYITIKKYVGLLKQLGYLVSLKAYIEKEAISIPA